MRMDLRPLSLALLLLVACKHEPTPAPQTPTDASAVDLPSKVERVELAADAIVQRVAFLADDAQEGRHPGSEADLRVQNWVANSMQEAGLAPAGSEGFFQRFEVGDGVRLRDSQQSALRGPRDEELVAHALLPFGHDTGDAPVKGKLVFVGYGVPADDGPGDYQGLEAKVKGAIVVALAGSSDPHASPAKTRPQAKLIAARDRGAVGFVLWDPQSDVPWPNHGAFSELDIPTVAVGKQGSELLQKLLRVRGEAPPKPGLVSRVEVSLHTPIQPVNLPTANVIGRLPGSAPEAERKQIIIGAHMDHLGFGTASSLAPDQHAIHNGADDNASGVAVLLGLAEVLAAVPAEQRRHDLVFVAFGAEEMGLLGSAHFVAQLGEAKDRTLAMLNFDMVGRLRDKLTISGTGTAKEWQALLEPLFGELTVQQDTDGWGPSDHSSFYGEGIPVLHFFTGSHEDYHKPSDDIDKLNHEGAAQIGELAGRVLLSLVERADPLTYVKSERPQQGSGQFKVSLGTMPDYGTQADGLALAGVREGGPAAQAGLQKGDVIKKIGSREIHGIDDYMASFGELEPGKEVEIAFEREGKLQTTKLVPAAPRR